MISIIKTTLHIGVVFYDDHTGKFLHAERCDEHRLVQLVNTFPSHRIQILIDSDNPELVDEIFEYMPHIRPLAKVIKVKKLDVMNEIVKAARPTPKPRGYMLVSIGLGVLVGCLALLPTSMEYKNSVLEQAVVMQEYTQSTLNSKEEFTKSLDRIHNDYKVDAAVVNDVDYTIVFTSNRNDLTPDDFNYFEGANLTLEAESVDEEGKESFIYRLEGQR